MPSYSSRLPPVLSSAACAAAIALAGCGTNGASPSAHALRPLSPEMVARLEQKHMPKQSPILVRLFKEESELEIWKQDTTGRFAMLKTYPICRWSGQLGPKAAGEGLGRNQRNNPMQGRVRRAAPGSSGGILRRASDPSRVTGRSAATMRRCSPASGVLSRVNLWVRRGIDH
jgi:hypothetical protein